MRQIMCLVLGLAMFEMGCEKPLTREEALPIIKQKVATSDNVESKVYAKLLKMYFNGTSNQCFGATICMQPFLDSYNEDYRYTGQSERSTLEELKQKGYIQMVDSVDNSSCCITNYMNVVLTDKAKQLQGESTGKYYKLEISHKEVGFVTGIKETEKGKRAEVDFSILNHSNELAKILAPKLNQTNEEPYTAIFEKYDDGWRITSIQRH